MCRYYYRDNRLLTYSNRFLRVSCACWYSLHISKLLSDAPQICVVRWYHRCRLRHDNTIVFVLCRWSICRPPCLANAIGPVAYVHIWCLSAFKCLGGRSTATACRTQKSNYLRMIWRHFQFLYLVIYSSHYRYWFGWLFFVPFATFVGNDRVDSITVLL